jgi:excisionase family DNA binding protein
MVGVKSATVAEEELLNVREVALLLRVSESAVRRWIAQGSVPAITLPGGDYRLPRHELFRSFAATAGLDAATVLKRAEERLRAITDEDIVAEVAAVRHSRRAR